MFPAISRPVVFMPHIIRVCPSDRCQECLGIYFDGPVPFRMRVFHSGKLPVCICFPLISVVVGQWGFWPVVSRGVPFSVLSGFLLVASLSGVTLVN